MLRESIPWKDFLPPFKIFGNLYFVGSMPASTHIIDTGEGLIMIDSGYQHSLYMVIHNMHLLGLNPADIKYIFHTHGHIDHMGATRALVELTGATTVIGEADRDYVNGTRNLSWADELEIRHFGNFEPDILLNDGDEITLGNTTIKAIATPGHTEGAMTFFFDVTDGVSTYRAGLPGGMGLNSMKKDFLEKYNLPLSLRDDFIKSMDRLAEEKVDIYLGNHASQNRTPEKLEKLQNGDILAFVNPNEWAAAMMEAKQSVLELLEQERKEG